MSALQMGEYDIEMAPNTGTLQNQVDLRIKYDKSPQHDNLK